MPSLTIKKGSCSACHFGRSSQRRLTTVISVSPLFGLPFRQEFTATSPPGTFATSSCSACHFGRSSQRWICRRRSTAWLFGLPFRQEFTAWGRMGIVAALAVRPAISAGVHSGGLEWKKPSSSCSACHFGRSSQRARYWNDYIATLFGLPFRQEFTACGARRITPRKGCSACHFGRSSQRSPLCSGVPSGLFGLPFRQEFTADDS